MLKKTKSGFTLGRKSGRKVGVYKPKGGGSRIVRSWKPKK